MEKLKQWPAAFAPLADKINEIIDAQQRLTPGSGISFVTAEYNTVISADVGMPDGYGPESWSVYDGGVVTTRNFLTDNPD